MSVLNSWYAAQFSSHVKKDSIYSFLLFGESLLIFRDAEARPICLKNQCPHRASPLDLGFVSNGEIECPYHGARFGRDGSGDGGIVCKHIMDPANETVARSIRPWSYPCVEKQGYLWVFYTGRSSKTPIEAPIDQIPTDDYFGQAGWSFEDMIFDRETNWQFVIENHLDPQHLFYVHSKVIASWITRDKLENLQSDFSVVDEARGIAKQTFRHRSSGREVGTFFFIPPGRVVSGVFEFLEDLDKDRDLESRLHLRVSVLDHVPLNRSQSRYLARSYMYKTNPQVLLPGVLARMFYQSTTFKLGEQDEGIMRSQSLAVNSGDRIRQLHMLPEDKIIGHFMNWLRAEEKRCNPWSAHMNADNLPMVTGFVERKMSLIYPPANMSQVDRLRRRAFGTVLLAVLGFSLFAFVLLRRGT